MSERNNRSSYYSPTPHEVEAIKRGQGNVQWRDIWRVASKAAGRNLWAWEVHKMLGITPKVDNVKLHGMPVWGWWLIIPEAAPPLEDMVPICKQCDIVMGHHPDTGWTCSKCGAVATTPD